MRMNHKDTLRPRLRILTNLQDQYQVGPPVSIFHPQIHPTWKYCSNVISYTVLELGSLQWDKGLHQYTSGLISLPIQYQKCINFHLEKFSCPSWQLRLSENNLFSYSLQPCTWLAHLYTAYHSSHLKCHHLFLSSLLHFWVHLPA